MEYILPISAGALTTRLYFSAGPEVDAEQLRDIHRALHQADTKDMRTLRTDAIELCCAAGFTPHARQLKASILSGV